MLMKFTDRIHSVILGDKDTLVVGNGRQVQLGGHQGLGLNVHQDFVALLRVEENSSTLVLNQRGAQTSSPRVELRSPLPEVGFELGYDNAHQEEVDANI